MPLCPVVCVRLAGWGGPGDEGIGVIGPVELLQWRWFSALAAAAQRGGGVPLAEEHQLGVVGAEGAADLAR